MTEMFKLADKDFKGAIIKKMFHQATNMLGTNEKERKEGKKEGRKGERNLAELEPASSKVWTGALAIFLGQVNKMSILV